MCYKIVFHFPEILIMSKSIYLSIYLSICYIVKVSKDVKERLRRRRCYHLISVTKILLLKTPFISDVTSSNQRNTGNCFISRWKEEFFFFINRQLANLVECSSMARETGVQSQVELYQRLKKIVFNISLLNTQHYKVRIKGKVEQPKGRGSAFPIPRRSSHWKGNLRVTLDNSRQLYLL